MSQQQDIIERWNCSKFEQEFDFLRQTILELNEATEKKTSDAVLQAWFATSKLLEAPNIVLKQLGTPTPDNMPWTDWVDKPELTIYVRLEKECHEFRSIVIRTRRCVRMQFYISKRKADTVLGGLSTD